MCLMALVRETVDTGKFCGDQNIPEKRLSFSAKFKTPAAL